MQLALLLIPMLDAQNQDAVYSLVNSWQRGTLKELRKELLGRGTYVMQTGPDGPDRVIKGLDLIPRILRKYGDELIRVWKWCKELAACHPESPGALEPSVTMQPFESVQPSDFGAKSSTRAPSLQVKRSHRRPTTRTSARSSAPSCKVRRIGSKLWKVGKWTVTKESLGWRAAESNRRRELNYELQRARIANPAA